MKKKKERKKKRTQYTNIPHLKHQILLPGSSYRLLQQYLWMPKETKGKEMSELYIYIEETHVSTELKLDIHQSCFTLKGRIPITSSTFVEVFAEHSINIKPCSLANCSPSSVLTALLWAKSHLFPMSIMVMFAFACCLASSNQLARWLKVSLLKHWK